MIELQNLTKHYNGMKAVNNLTLTVPRGEVFGFIGPNGAGKTTTIRMMGGVIAPSSGEVRICGVDMARQPVAAKSRIGFIPDRPYLYDKLSGMEFLRFTADLYGVDESAFETRATANLEMFALIDWADELIESYSHGMKQRLIMAAALLHDPEVIIVDEPMVGLDPSAIRMVKALFKELGRKGVSVFMSTHTLKVAEDICDRIGIIRKGELIATGDIEDLKHKARMSDADLEAVFLNLTADERVDGG